MTEDTLDQCRASLAAALTTAAADWVEYPINFEFDNRNVINSIEQDTPHVSVMMKFNGARQADLSSNPVHRHIGFYILTVKVKQGQGTAKVLQLLEFLYTRLQRRTISGVHLEMASVVSPASAGEWYGASAMIPFRIDKV